MGTNIAEIPLITVIIPHAGGQEILQECLSALQDTRQVHLEIIIVENGSSDAKDVVSQFLNVQLLHYQCMLGFAAACNRGVEASNGELVFLLNNDAVVNPDTLLILSRAFNDDDRLAACQPKLLSYDSAGYFDYSSAAGGEIDRYGFPFARGRVFDSIEEDVGQYDEVRNVFWGAGAALMIRRKLYLEAGGLEEPYFAHMEEIDLLWRLQLMGYLVKVIPQAVARHRGASSIKSGSFTKIYLNHRNSIATLFRNYSLLSFIRFFPIRLVLDGIAVLHALFERKFVRMWAILRAECWFWLSLPYLIRTHRQVQKLRRIPDKQILTRIYPHSVVWQYFIRKRKTWRELYSQEV